MTKGTNYPFYLFLNLYYQSNEFSSHVNHSRGKFYHKLTRKKLPVKPGNSIIAIDDLSRIVYRVAGEIETKNEQNKWSQYRNRSLTVGYSSNLHRTQTADCPAKEQPNDNQTQPDHKGDCASHYVAFAPFPPHFIVLVRPQTLQRHPRKYGEQS